MTATDLSLALPALAVAPLVGAVLAFAVPRLAGAVAAAAGVATLAAAAALVAAVATGGPLALSPGGWPAPLGVALAADGLSALMIALAAVVGTFVAVQAGLTGTRGEGAWSTPLWLVLWAGLNALFLNADLFTLYVALELVALAAVALTALGGKAAALQAAMRYFVVGLTGSLLVLLGVGLLYAAHGRLDFAGLAAAMTPGPAASIPAALIVAGLALKAALVPLHGWLPAAHANAVPAASALLSAVVVKAAFYALLRLWFDLFASVTMPAAGLLLGALGSVAVVWGSVQALRARRLKLLVAYSTVAQLGYLFLVFALAGPDGLADAWSGVVLLALSHGLAKAAMFLACGRIAETAGHDTIARLGRSPVRPVTAEVAFALAAISLIGLPPSAAFLGKWLILVDAVRDGLWVVVAVVAAGTVLSAFYFLPVVARFLRAGPGAARAGGGTVPLVLALGALALGLVAGDVVAFATIDAVPPAEAA